MPLKSDIRQVRPLRLDPNWSPPDVAKLRSWVSRLGNESSQVTLTVLGPHPEYRASIYRMLEGDIFNTIVDKSTYSYDWTNDPLIDNIFQRVSVPNILEALAVQKDLNLSPELTRLIDKGFFRVTEAFKILWETRFLLEESQEDEAFELLQNLADWSIGSIPGSPLLEKVGVSKAVITNTDRYDMFFLWITLARHNGIFDRLILPFDGFERVQTDTTKIGELTELVDAADRWKAMGSPLGIALGVVHLNLEPALKNLLISLVV